MPIIFPVATELPRSRWHTEAKALLADCIEREFLGRVMVSRNRFLYWDAADPKRCMLPDLAVRRGVGKLGENWFMWELGAPDVGVELLSNLDRPAIALEETLERYRQAGVGEVVCFERDDAERPIRAWDAIDGDLVERDVTGPDGLFCDALELYWCAHEDPELGLVLRLARDVEGRSLVG